jgi:hypothetical protein
MLSVIWYIIVGGDALGDLSFESGAPPIDLVDVVVDGFLVIFGPRLRFARLQVPLKPLRAAVLVAENVAKVRWCLSASFVSSERSDEWLF